MPSCPQAERWVTRAQPWLGTLVEVALPPDDATDERFAAAFAAIAHVHRRMNAHDPASDLGRIACAAHRRVVIVDRQTMAVLRLARRLALATRGRFDVTTPPRRPGGPRHSARRAGGDGMNAIHLGPGRGVRTDGAVAIDLSGIAKGHAVDLAVAALRTRGARAGLVNAGGDLRVFGRGVWLPVRVRLPHDPTRALPLFEACEAAAATSADYFRDKQYAGALFDAQRRRARRFAGSFTVVAPTCALADALTKVVALAPARAATLLSRHGAHAIRLSGSDGTLATTTCRRSTPHLRLPPAWET